MLVSAYHIFKKKYVGVRFATDNIDLQEDAANGQGSFHGTEIVTFQEDVPGKPINNPIVIAKKLIKSELLQLRREYLPEIHISKSKHIRFDSFTLGQRKHIKYIDK